jgi:23S rRNA (adenine2030-N6)-methyltransferase
MFSYQHEYHAGNHADIFKHVCLTLILESLCKKDKPFTVIDMHAGSALYALNDERLLKTGEAESGIKKLFEFCSIHSITLPEGMKEYLKAEEPYLKNGLYAGSPEIARLYMRNGDALFLTEMHPQAAKNLEENMKMTLLRTREDGSCAEEKCPVKPVIKIEDSYTALNALTPPKIKRGLILCDPSYEDASDYKKVTEAIKNAHKKWNTAVIAVWYPLLLRRKNETAQMLSSLEDYVKLGLNQVQTVRLEMAVKNPDELDQDSNAHLYGSGMFLINPPWQVKEKMEKVASVLKKILV